MCSPFEAGHCARSARPRSATRSKMSSAGSGALAGLPRRRWSRFRAGSECSVQLEHEAEGFVDHHEVVVLEIVRPLRGPSIRSIPEPSIGEARLRNALSTRRRKRAHPKRLGDRPVQPRCDGDSTSGDDGNRTHDILLAKQVLCQLSYVPEYSGPVSEAPARISARHGDRGVSCERAMRRGGRWRGTHSGSSRRPW